MRMFWAKYGKFLSTLSLRRATDGEAMTQWECEISIHALLAESDEAFRDGNETARKFLSTLSLRRASYINKHIIAGRRISIHALLAESD